ncbi:MAG: tyrosinase family protein [Nitrosopumilaceae archaeon]
MGVRKNQATLTAQEKQNFVNAVLALKANGTYDQFVQQHRDSMAMSNMWAHRGPAFLSWHREFLRRFELALQAVNPTVDLPYWDWTIDNSTTSSIWGSNFMGGNGRQSDGRVMTGPFAFDNGNWNLNVNDDPGQDLRRRMGQGASSLPTAAQVNQCLAVTPYDSAPWNASSNPSFRNMLEGWIGPGQIHNRVHVWVGGSMMATTSPNDPVFFLHHCNVDRLWAIWQSMHPTEGYLPVSGGPLGHNLNDPMLPWGSTATPASVLNISSLGYSYDNMSPSTGSTTPPSGGPSGPGGGGGGCFIATAAYGSELEPPVQFLREFRDNVVLQSRFKKPFEKILDEYYKFSPPIAELMKRNKPFKYTMKYTVVWPFVALAKATAFVAEPFVDDGKKSKQ